MKLPRLAHDPALVAEFYGDALQACGALCERTWHDRLAVVAEGRAARLWNEDGRLHEVELRFPSADASGPRDAARDVFPGCPLTFHLAELINPQPVTLERLALGGVAASARPPTPDVAEKIWRNRWPDTRRWRLETPFVAGHQFGLLALVRCEIQAMDQQWRLLRVACSLPGGEPDSTLADERFLEPAQSDSEAPDWPVPDPPAWQSALARAIEVELAPELATVRERQARYLRRELDRVDDYFEGYQRELSARRPRGGVAAANDTTDQKLEARRAAARAEHARRRHDQVHRHEIRVVPHVDALLLVAEPAWATHVRVVEDRSESLVAARFIPRNRRWFRS